VPDRSTFLPQVRVLLDELGYDVTAESPEAVTAKPRFNACLFGGSLRIVVEDHGATIHGPKISAEILRKRMRLAHHLVKVQSVLGERRVGEPVLKRVEMSLRVKAEQMAEIQARVIEPLLASGDVVCDLRIVVQSEHGLPEGTIEQQVRSWAKKNEVPCDIHKHHSKLFDPTSRRPASAPLI
jgi:hypothetical protein